MKQLWIGRWVGISVIAGSYLLHGWSWDIMTRVSIMRLMEGVGLGLILFEISFMLTSQGQKFDWASLARRHIWISQAFWKSIWIYGVLTSFWEEWVWRVGLQSIFQVLWGNWVSIVLTAFLFALNHQHRFHGRPIRMGEFLGFSFVLSVVFALTHCFWIVVFIHAIRNVLTVCFRFELLKQA